jgi:hypothetical protein
LQTHHEFCTYAHDSTLELCCLTEFIPNQPEEVPNQPLSVLMEGTVSTGGGVDYIPGNLVNNSRAWATCHPANVHLRTYLCFEGEHKCVAWPPPGQAIQHVPMACCWEDISGCTLQNVKSGCSHPAQMQIGFIYTAHGALQLAAADFREPQKSAECTPAGGAITALCI